MGGVGVSERLHGKSGSGSEMQKLLLAICAVPAALSAEEAIVDYVVENGATIPVPLAEGEYERAAGAALYRSAGCADCHKAPGASDAPAIGPDLSGAGARLTAGEIRLSIVNPAILNPATEMPAYYDVGALGDVPDELVGRTRLTAKEVEALVAWLAALE